MNEMWSGGGVNLFTPLPPHTMIQPFVQFLFAALLASTVLAQSVLIALPTANAEVTSGSSITVKLDQPVRIHIFIASYRSPHEDRPNITSTFQMALTGSQDVAVVIGFVSCSSATECPDVTERLGEILYSGSYSPQLYNSAGNPYQNFTVAIPSGYSGPVQLGVAHFYLLAVCISLPRFFVRSARVDDVTI